MYYRQFIPAHGLLRYHDDVTVTFSDGSKNLTDEQLESFDIVLLHSAYFNGGFLKRCQDKAVKVVLDVDDDWYLERFHPRYDEWNKLGKPKMMEESFRLADCITTTTKLLKDKLLPFNDNVHILRNCINYEDRQYAIDYELHKPLRFGYTGAAGHEKDVELLLGAGTRFDIWMHYYYGGYYGNRFKYFPPVPISNFGQEYNKYDVILVPLQDVRFNKYKSELKLIECGFMRKAIIISDVMPYSPYLKHKENCLTARKPKDFIKWMQFLTDHPDWIERLGEGLYETVKDKFDYKTISNKRYQIFKELCGASISTN